MSRTYAPIAPEQTPAPAPEAGFDPQGLLTGLLSSTVTSATQLAMFISQGPVGNAAIAWRMSQARDARRAGEQLDGLAAMSPTDRAAAISGMDDDAYEGLLDDLPAERQRELGGLFNEVQDPSRKLALWERWHTAEAEARLGHDAAALDDTRAEIEDEASLMRERIEMGHDVNADLGDLALRKDRELYIEDTYDTNLTNTHAPSLIDRLLGLELEEERVTWSEGELDAVERSLSDMPAEHLAVSPAGQEIRRAHGDGSKEKGNTALTEDGAVLVDDLSRPEAEVKHATGRALAESGTRLKQTFEGVAGYESPLGPVQPTTDGVEPNDPSSWAGAAGGSAEYLAELYEHMTLSPEATRALFIDDPMVDRKNAGAQLRRASQLLAGAQESGDPVLADELEKERGEAQYTADYWERRQRSMQAQYELVVNDVLGWGAGYGG